MVDLVLSRRHWHAEPRRARLEEKKLRAPYRPVDTRLPVCDPLDQREQ